MDTALDVTVSIPGCFVNVFGMTDTGMVRGHNEDNFLIADLSARNTGVRPEVTHHRVEHFGSLFMVADGMGGGAAGEVASQMAVSHVYHQFSEELRTLPHLDKNIFVQKLKKAVEYANGAIFQESRNNPEFKGMGTTTSAAGLLKGSLFIAQVGDSRAYLVRNKTIKQITKDQSLVNKLLDAGLITEEEAENHENKNVILQALGVNEKVEVIVSTIDLRLNDTLIICSDGLSGLVKAEEISQVVQSAPSQEDACRTLIGMANQRGGHDNITVIIARFDGEALPPAQPQDTIEYRLFSESSPPPAEPAVKPAPAPAVRPPESVPQPAPSPAGPAKPFRWSLLAAIAFPILVLLAVVVWVYLSDAERKPASVKSTESTMAPSRVQPPATTVPPAAPSSTAAEPKPLSAAPAVGAGAPDSAPRKGDGPAPGGTDAVRARPAPVDKKPRPKTGSAKGKSTPALEAIETQAEGGGKEDPDAAAVEVEIRTDPPELMKLLRISRNGSEVALASRMKPGLYKLTLPVEGTLRTLPDMDITPGGKNFILVRVDPLGGDASIDRRVEP